MRKNYNHVFYKIVILIAFVAVSKVTAQSVDTDQNKTFDTNSQNDEYVNKINTTDFKQSMSKVTRTVKFQDSLDIVFGIYPNPISDYFTITGFDDLKALEIYDKRGNKLKTYISPELTRSISVEDIDNGVYWIKGYFFPKESVFRRVVIKH